MKIKKYLKDFTTIVKYNLKIEMRYPLSYIAGIFNMFFWMLSISILVIILSGQKENIILGNIIIWGFIGYMIYQTIISEVGFGIYRLQRRGTLEQIFLTPIPHWILPLGLAGFSLTIAMIFSILVILFLSTMLNIPLIITNPLQGILATILLFNMTYGLALIYAGIAIKTKKSSWALVNALQMIFLLFCGVFYSFKTMPQWLLTISKTIPFSYAIDLMRTTIIGIPPELAPKTITIMGTKINGATFEWIITATISTTLLTAGYTYLNKKIKEAKKKGLLATY